MVCPTSLGGSFFNGSPWFAQRAREGFRFSMVCPTGPGGFVFQWFAQRVWRGFVFQWFAQRVWRGFVFQWFAQRHNFRQAALREEDHRQGGSNNASRALVRSTSQHVADLLSKRDSLHETSAMSRSECEREARDAAADLVLSASLPRLVRMGSRVLDSDKMRKLLDYNSIGCKQALRIFDELVDAESEPVEPDFPQQCLEKRQNAPATPPVKPQSPRQPIHLNLKRKADHQPNQQPEQQAEQEATTVLLLPRAARCAPEPAASAEDFMNNAGELIFESAAHVALVCEEFRHTGPGVREADLLDCLYEAGEEKYQCKGCAWAAWRLMGQAQQIPSVTHATLQPEEGASTWVFFHKTAMKLLPRPPPFTRLHKLGKGKLHDLVKLMTCCGRKGGP